MTLCDQAGCTARATREVQLDNGLSLWACSHHSAEWIPGLSAETRFDLEPTVIVT